MTGGYPPLPAPAQADPDRLMQTLHWVRAFADAHPVLTGVAVASAGLLAAGIGLLARRLLAAAARPVRAWAAARPAEDVLTVAAACIATGVSAQGMWRFSGDVLGFDGPLRLGLFAFIEVAVITSAIRARRNMRHRHTAGVDGAAVWALTCLSAVLSAMDARSLAETVFRLAAPLVAAWLWERGLSIERHRLTGGPRIHWRVTPERVLVRLGLAEATGRTTGEVDAHRRLTRVALAAKRARRLRAAGARPARITRALARLDRRVEQAVKHQALTQDPGRLGTLMQLIGVLFSAEDLVRVRPRSPWGATGHEDAAAGGVDGSETSARAGCPGPAGTPAETRSQAPSQTPSETVPETPAAAPPETPLEPPPQAPSQTPRRASRARRRARASRASAVSPGVPGTVSMPVTGRSPARRAPTLVDRCVEPLTRAERGRDRRLTVDQAVELLRAAGLTVSRSTAARALRVVHRDMADGTVAAGAAVAEPPFETETGRAGPGRASGDGAVPETARATAQRPETAVETPPETAETLAETRAETVPAGTGPVTPLAGTGGEQP